jgi:hypothetical protein
MAITKSEFTGQMVQDRFFNDYRELIAHYSDVPAGIVAFLEMNCPDELVSLSNTLDTKLYRNLLSEALITLIDRQALTPIAELNDLAQKDLVRLRRETGIGAETLPPPPPTPLTADELLEQEVRRDYVNLPGDKMREKRRNSRAYEAMFQKIAETLDSRVTANVRAGG